MQRSSVQSFHPETANLAHHVAGSPETKRDDWPKATSWVRLGALESVSHPARVQVEHLIDIARRGLPRMHRRGAFGHTLRGIRTRGGHRFQLEGDDIRFAAIVALGLSCLDTTAQREVLGGGTAADLARVVATRAEIGGDTGAMALAAWAAAEAANLFAATLLYRLDCALGSDTAAQVCALSLVAATSARYLGDTSALIKKATTLVLQRQGPHGLFLNATTASSGGQTFNNAALFDDQVYSIQALARLHAATGDCDALAAAQKCADRICLLQGPDGQWWCPDDARSGQAIEDQPVYSARQHAMAPMALLELQEACGTARWTAVVKGLRWLAMCPKVGEPLISDRYAVIWRKAGRRERRKRGVPALFALLRPVLPPRWLESTPGPKRVDYECKPYELGWLLYAWLSAGRVRQSQD